MEVVDLTSNCSKQPCLPKKKKISEWVSSSFMDLQSNAKNTTSAKRKFARHKSCDVSKTPPDSQQTWLERYAPMKEDELAVHKKKILEVDNWILAHQSHKKKSGAPILIIIGPPGCGKTATLMVVAKKHGIQVSEWINPLTTPYTVTQQAGLRYESQNAQFEDFLFRSGKYPSLMLSNNNNKLVENDGALKLVLLEELPQYIYQDPTCFKDILRKYRMTQRLPLVVILSDGSSTDAVKRQVISKDFQQHAGITQISFNAVSATLMSKTLGRVAQLERRNLTKEELAMLSSACAGDIRAGINALQFSSQSEVLTAKSFKSTSSKKSRSLALGSKDTTLILFRALGKILYCKREAPSRPLTCRDASTFRDPLLMQPEEVIDQCCLSGKAFGLFLHHNYMPFFEQNPVEDFAAAADYFSAADLMNSPLTSSDPSSGAGATLDRFEGILAARGLLYSNSTRATAELCSKASGSWRPLHKPSWYQVTKGRQENMVNVSCSFWKLRQPPQELLCTTLPYLLHLRAQNTCDPVQRMLLNDVVALPKFKLFHSIGDNRVGEQFAGDDTLEVTDARETQVTKVSDADETAEDVDEVVEIEEFSD